MGSIMAAGYALSNDWEETIPRFKAQLEGMLSDYTLPFVSMVRGRRFDRYLQTLFGDTNIEDLQILDFSVADQAVEIGYAYGTAEIASWRKAGGKSYRSRTNVHTARRSP